MRKAIVVFHLACLMLMGTVRDVSCSGTITTSLQSAITASVDGDVVNIGAGTCASGPVTWTNKNITIQGQGRSLTNISFESGGFRPVITNPAKAQFRITGMTFYGPNLSQPVLFINSEDCTSYSYGWRVDNNTFNYTGTMTADPITGWGVTFGLFDQNVFSFNAATWILFSFFQTGLGELTWGSPTVDQVGGWYNLSLPTGLGTDKFIVFEDNTFTAINTYSAFFDASSGGSRVVFRRNTFSGGFLYNHWVRGNDLDVFVWEVYNNKFIGTASWGGGGSEIAVRFESGTGVFYNNTFTGTWAADNKKFYVDDRRACNSVSGETGGQFGVCDGSKAWDGNAGDPAVPGWPCLAQIGRGTGKTYAQITGGDKLPSQPAYAWSNGTQEKCWNPGASGDACSDSIAITNYYSACAYVSSTPHSNGEVDFVNNGSTPMSGYTQLAYPHPLRGGTNSHRHTGGRVTGGRR
jgi:hypothetical protein